MILLKDVAAYVVDGERFTREEHGGFAYKAAQERSVETGKPITTEGENSTRAGTGWVSGDA